MVLNPKIIAFSKINVLQIPLILRYSYEDEIYPDAEQQKKKLFSNCESDDKQDVGKYICYHKVTFCLNARILDLLGK